MMRNFAITLILIATFSFGLFSQAAQSRGASANYEMLCRSKAKDLAAEAYRTCVTENKTAQIEQLRKEYQAKLNALKAHYESKISSVGGKRASKKSAGTSPVNRKEKTTTMNFDTPTPAATEPSSENTEETMEIPEPIPVETENL